MSEKAQIARKRKRTSKKTKKSWRKNCDITDVESFLEDQRVQEGTGGLAANKANDQLFYFDTKTVQQVDSKSSLRGRSKPLRCLAVLNPDPMIPPARTCHNERRDKTKPSTTLRQSRRQSSFNKQAPVKQTSWPSQSPTFDLWGSNDITAPPSGVDEHYLTICKKKRIKPPSYHGKKPSAVPAVEIPVAGASYRPTDKDHKELLKLAVDIEKRKIRNEQRIKRALDDKFPIAADAPNENTWLDEWEQSGLFDDDDEKDKEESEVCADDAEDSRTVKLSNNPPVRRENKKTERERRRLKAAKLAERDLEQQKEDRLRQHGTLRLKSLKKEVIRREMVLAARRTRRQLIVEKTNATATRKLGRVKYEEPNLELKLSGEQRSSLRLLKPEGNLVVDRFKSFQKRNMIEPRQRAKVVVKYKPKAFEKKSHKLVT